MTDRTHPCGTATLLAVENAVLAPGAPSDYAAKLQTLVRTWRQAWGRDDLPFYSVQLSTYRYGAPHNQTEQNTPERLPAFQDAQRRVTAPPHAGPVVTIDLTDSTANLHPVNQREIGLTVLADGASRCRPVASGS